MTEYTTVNTSLTMWLLEVLLGAGGLVLLGLALWLICCDDLLELAFRGHMRPLQYAYLNHWAWGGWRERALRGLWDWYCVDWPCGPIKPVGSADYAVDNIGICAG